MGCLKKPSNSCTKPIWLKKQDTRTSVSLLWVVEFALPLLVEVKALSVSKDAELLFYIDS
jgi:hypothetical protein